MFGVGQVDYCYIMPTFQVPFIHQPTQLRQILLRIIPCGYTHTESWIPLDFPTELQLLDKLPQVNQSQSEILECSTVYLHTSKSILGVPAGIGIQ